MSNTRSFHVGKVNVYLRGRIWYLCYFEQGKRRRPRVGPNRDAARQLAAQINAQLETGATTSLSFEPISVSELRERWLEHHEQVRRSSVQSINRYRTATEHLLCFLEKNPVRHAGVFSATMAAEFVRYLRTLRVSPNGHPNTPKRPLLDKGLQFVLECCRAMFNHAARRRHLPPYSENPFSVIEIDRIPVETARSIVLLTPDQEKAFLKACDVWQFPIYLTLLLTGLRPGELCHLLLPDDLDLAAGLLRVRNKPALGWQVKTRNQRDIPLIPVLAEVLRAHLNGRNHGPVFQRRTWMKSSVSFDLSSTTALERELTRRIAEHDKTAKEPATRATRSRLAQSFWRTIGLVSESRVRVEFMRVTRKAGLSGQTAPKVLRHQFATRLQEKRVDPLIRNLLMGHASADPRSAGHGLGMTAVYTHSRPETVREQLLAALEDSPATAVAREWLVNSDNSKTKLLIQTCHNT
jgi:integrase